MVSWNIHDSNVHMTANSLRNYVNKVSLTFSTQRDLSWSISLGKYARSLWFRLKNLRLGNRLGFGGMTISITLILSILSSSSRAKSPSSIDFFDSGKEICKSRRIFSWKISFTNSYNWHALIKFIKNIISCVYYSTNYFGDSLW